MVGLQPLAHQHQLAICPRLPAGWPWVRVSELLVGEHVLSLRITPSSLDVLHSAGPTNLELLYRLPDVIRLNADHSLGSFLDEQARQNRISRSEARRNRNRNALRSALTGSKIDLIDLRSEPLELRPGDWIVLASDGICTLAGDEIADVVYRQRQSTPDEMADALIAGRDDYAAVRALLAGEAPRVRGRAGGVAIQTMDLNEQNALVAALDSSCLFIQGPPGSGKTYTGARLIVSLISAGRRVGVAATSHKAINNLLAEVESAAREAGVVFDGLKKCSDDDDEFDGGRCAHRQPRFLNSRSRSATGSKAGPCTEKSRLSLLPMPRKPRWHSDCANSPIA